MFSFLSSINRLAFFFFFPFVFYFSSYPRGESRHETQSRDSTLTGNHFYLFIICPVENMNRARITEILNKNPTLFALRSIRIE